MKDAVDVATDTLNWLRPKDPEDFIPDGEKVDIIAEPPTPKTKDVLSAALETPGVRGTLFWELKWSKSHVDPFRKGRENHREL